MPAIGEWPAGPFAAPHGCGRWPGPGADLGQGQVAVLVLGEARVVDHQGAQLPVPMLQARREAAARWGPGEVLSRRDGWALLPAFRSIREANRGEEQAEELLHAGQGLPLAAGGEQVGHQVQDHEVIGEVAVRGRRDLAAGAQALGEALQVELEHVQAHRNRLPGQVQVGGHILQMGGGRGQG